MLCFVVVYLLHDHGEAGREQNSAGSGTAPMPALHGETGRPKWLLSNLFSVVFAYLFPSS